MTTSIPLIRIVDDDPVVADSLRFYLEVSGFQVQAYESGEAFLSGMISIKQAVSS